MPTKRSPREILEAALSAALVDEDGEPYRVELLPGMTDAEIDAAQTGLPCAIPEDIRELVRFSRGIVEPGGDFTFIARPGECSYDMFFPFGMDVAADGFGNSWVLDLTSASTTWGPVLFACHDAPVLLYQSDTLAEFLEEWFKMYVPPHASLVDDVHEDRLFHVWTSNPGVLSFEEAASRDLVLAQFARSLGDRYLYFDMRAATPGQGFSWGRYGAKTVVHRCGEERIFAYRLPDRRGLARLLFGPYKND